MGGGGFGKRGDVWGGALGSLRGWRGCWMGGLAVDGGDDLFEVGQLKMFPKNDDPEDSLNSTAFSSSSRA